MPQAATVMDIKIYVAAEALINDHFKRRGMLSPSEKIFFFPQFNHLM